jgi:hypothetical protein
MNNLITTEVVTNKNNLCIVLFSQKTVEHSLFGSYH